MILEKTMNKKKHIKSKEIESILDLIILDYIKQNIKKEKDSLKDFIWFFERKVIDTALGLTNGNQKASAKILGVRETTLHEKIRKLGICIDNYKPKVLNIIEDRLESLNTKRKSIGISVLKI